MDRSDGTGELSSAGGEFGEMVSPDACRHDPSPL